VTPGAREWNNYMSYRFSNIYVRESARSDASTESEHGAIPDDGEGIRKLRYSGRSGHKSHRGERACAPETGREEVCARSRSMLNLTFRAREVTRGPSDDYCFGRFHIDN